MDATIKKFRSDLESSERTGNMWWEEKGKAEKRADELVDTIESKNDEIKKQKDGVSDLQHKARKLELENAKLVGFIYSSQDLDPTGKPWFGDTDRTMAYNHDKDASDGKNGKSMKPDYRHI